MRTFQISDRHQTTHPENWEIIKVGLMQAPPTPHPTHLYLGLLFKLQKLNIQ